MTSIKCPQCEQLFDPGKSKAMPFCSSRCRTLDLGQWLDEEHSVPFVEIDPDEEPPEYV